MARTRKRFSTFLKDALPDVSHFYFNPPNGTQMEYPCVVYRRVINRNKRADNLAYLKRKQYMVTLIDRNPDSPFPDLLEDLPYCGKDREFCQGNLYHYVYTIFF